MNDRAALTVEPSRPSALSANPWAVGGLACVAVVLALGAAGWRLASPHGAPGVWQEYLSTAPGFVEVPGDRRSPDWRESSRAIDELLRRPRWSTGEAEKLIAYIARNADLKEIAPEELDLPTMEKVAVSEQAAGAVADRLRFGGPIDAPAKAQLEAALLGLLQHASPDVRIAGVQFVVFSGLVEQGDARTVVDRLASSDPSPKVREQAARQIHGFDSCRQTWEELKRKRDAKP